MPLNKKLCLTFLSSKYKSKTILKRKKKNRLKNFIQVKDEGGEGNGHPLQCSCLENAMDRGTWQAIVCGVARVGHSLATKLLLLKFTLEKETATHSSILAWRIPWAEEPGGLQSMGSQRVGHD